METQLSFKDRAKQAFYFYAGIGQGVVDTAKGLAKLSLLPATQGLDALGKAADFISHPQEKAEAAYQEAKQGYKDLQRLWSQPKEEISKGTEKLGNAVQHEWNEFTKPFESSDPNVRAKAWGETTFNVASLFYGAGELKGASVATKELSVFSKAEIAESKIVSQLAETGAEIASPSSAASSTLQASVQLYERIPAGFNNSKEFEEFGNLFREGLQKSADPEAIGVLRGSSVTGVKHKNGLPFDTGKRSDLDLTVVSPKLLKRAEEMGVKLREGKTRTGPLDPDFFRQKQILKKLNLFDSIQSLRSFSNRDVSLMIYDSEASVAGRGEYIKFGDKK
ncbi:MAG: hypothetical protein HQM15_01050 [Deltaproteobacteria bacterium]|nr:hypothetical protein [Deltaproteobacteria bacterium]